LQYALQSQSLLHVTLQMKQFYTGQVLDVVRYVYRAWIPHGRTCLTFTKSAACTGDG